MTTPQWKSGVSFSNVVHSVFAEKQAKDVELLTDSVSLSMSFPSVAILTTKIRNFQEHLQKHNKVSNISII